MKEVTREEFYASPFYTTESNIEMRCVGEHPYTTEYIVRGTRSLRAKNVSYFENPNLPYPELNKYYIAE